MSLVPTNVPLQCEGSKVTEQKSFKVEEKRMEVMEQRAMNQ